MKKYIAHLSLFIITLWSISFVGCKKADTVIENPSPHHIVAQFFNHTANLPTATQRMATLLRQKEQSFAFAANFITQQGIPLWQFATVNYKAPSGTAYHYQRNGTVESVDTIVKIPLQLQGVQTVHGYLLCTLSASGVAVAVIDGRQYAQYGFLNDAANEVSAENIAAEIMQFNYAIFGYNHFVVTDKRLFGNGIEANVLRTVRFDSAANNGTNTGSRAGLCPGGRVTVSVTTAVQHCPYPAGQCTGPNGSCDGCTEYNCATYSTEVYSFCSQDAPPSSSPQTVVWTLEQPTDPVGGGVIPPGWVPTLTDPCITTTAGVIATTICGLGWVNGNVPTTASEPEADNNDGIWWQDSTTDFPAQMLPSFADMNSNFPKKADGTEKCAQDVFNEVGGQVLAQGGTNACALRMSIALNKSGIIIPYIANQTYMGADGKFYFLSAAKLYNFMFKTFKIPPNATGSRVSFSGAQGGIDGSSFSNLLSGKKGIYLMRPNYPGYNYFNASGHATIFNGNTGVANTCDPLHISDGTYFNATGGVHTITLWQLN